MNCVLFRNFKLQLGKLIIRNLSIESYDKYRITLLHPDSFDTAINFMKKNFADDPLSRAFGATDCRDYSNLLEYMWMDDLKAGLSLQAVATDNSNKMIGLIINAPCNEEEVSKKFQEFADASASQPTKYLIKAWLELIQQPPFGPYATKQPNTAIGLSGVAVSNEYRSLGIAKRLILQTLCLAKCHGFQVAKIDCTSEFSALTANSMGFQCIYEKPIKRFEGIQTVQEPHTHARVFARLLDGFLL